MSDRRYYFAAEQFSTNGDNDSNTDGLLYACKKGNAHEAANEANEPDAEKDDDSEFLQDVPYSSSSVDRSSIGSIPWADDAIKKNKVDWERVERLLSGEEQLPEQEPELRSEIADWQRKFPVLVGRQAKPLQQQSFDSSRLTLLDDSADIDSMSNLSLNSLDHDDDDEDDGFLTPTAERQRQLAAAKYQESRQQQQQQPTRKYLRQAQHLVDLLDKDLRIASVKLRKRDRNMPQQPTMSPTTTTTAHSATAARARLRMPPILNVLDSNRRFRGLLNNRSFVQLTQVQQQQQAKSAALTHATSAERRQLSNRAAWHMPVATAAFGNRFLHNKHTIVLPALNRNRDFSTNRATITATSSQSNSSGGGAHNSHSNSSSLGSGLTTSRRSLAYNQQHHYNVPLVHVTTNSSNTPSTGRSISAAVHHPRSDYMTNAFYIPYSASKFKAFK